MRFVIQPELIMIDKIYLNVNEDLPPAILKFDEEKQDYVFEQIPNGLTRSELSELHSEMWRITDQETWEQHHK